MVSDDIIDGFELVAGSNFIVSIVGGGGGDVKHRCLPE